VNNILLYLGGALLVILAALFAVPLFIDWSSYRGSFEEEASRLLGREVRVGGNVNLRLLPTPYVRFEKVRIADNTGSFGDPFLRVDSFTMWLSMPPLLRGAVEANEIELTRPVIHIAMDGNGEGNWQGFGANSANVPFLPADVALQLVKIQDGVLALHATSGAERVRFEGINGELSTPALDGPYKFRGRLKFGGAPREVRIATGKRQPDGVVALKASIEALDSHAVYDLEGSLENLAKAPKFSGTLDARLPLRSLAGADRAQAKSTDQSVAELKSAVRADSAGLQLTDIAVAFEQAGRPQLMSGSANIDWRDAIAANIELAARWLDLDHISSANSAASPAVALRQLASGAFGILPTTGKTRASIKIDQANFGGDTISAVTIDLDRTSEAIRVNEVRASLPGGNGLIATGELSMAAGKLVYRGPVFVRGGNLGRFLGWCNGAPIGPELRADSVFSLSGEVTAGEEAMAISRMLGEVAGASFGGELSYRWAGARKLALRFESDRIELSAVLPPETTLADLRKSFTQADTAKASTAAAASKGAADARIDTALSLRIGQLATGGLLGGRTLRDLTADVRMAGSSVKVPVLKFSSDDGLGLEAEGEVSEVEGRPKGTVRFLAEAASAATIDGLAELLELPAPMWPGGAQAAALTPLRLAGTATFGGRAQGTADLNMDGALKDSRLSVVARLDGGVEGWRSHNGELTAFLQNDNGSRLLGQIVPGRLAGSNAGLTAARTAGPGRVSVRLSGIPAEGMAVAGRIDTPVLSAQLNGRMAAKDSSNVFDGDVAVGAADASDLLALAGFKSGFGLVATAIEGTAHVVRNEGRLKLDQARINVGGTEVSLSGTFDIKPGAPPVLNLTLAAADAQLPRLMALVLDNRGGSIAQARSLLGGQGLAASEVWPDAPFDFASLGEIQGQIKLRAGRIGLDGDLGLRNATLEAELRPGALELTALNGEALAGKVTSHWKLEKAAAGALLTGNLRLDTAALESFGNDADGQPIAKGRANLEFEVSGKGLSPRGVVGLLSGAGTLKLGPSSIARLSPSAVETVAEAVLAGKLDPGRGNLAATLGDLMRRGRLAIGPRTVDVEFADGAMKLKPVVLETDAARVSSHTSLDIAALKVSSDWRIEPKPRPDKPTERERVALPAVAVIYSGPLADLSLLESQILTDAMERELGVRKMEREVEALERLRREAEKRRDGQSATAVPSFPSAPQGPLSAPPATVVPNAATNPTMPLVGPPLARLGAPPDVGTAPDSPAGPNAPGYGPILLPPATSNPAAANPGATRPPNGAASRASVTPKAPRPRSNADEKPAPAKSWDPWNR